MCLIKTLAYGVLYGSSVWSLLIGGFTTMAYGLTARHVCTPMSVLFVDCYDVLLYKDKVLALAGR